MKILPINAGYNYKTGTNKVQNQQTFGSKLLISLDAENLMKAQALEASFGDTARYKELIGGFGEFMVELSNKLKNIGSDNEIIGVDLNPLLKEYLELPRATRGAYTRDQLCILRGIPQMQDEYTYYPFTYRPGNNGLVDMLCECAKKLLNVK